jgi:hypothetical protein
MVFEVRYSCWEPVFKKWDPQLFSIGIAPCLDRFSSLEH